MSFFSRCQINEERTLSIFIFKYNFNTENMSHEIRFILHIFKKSLIVKLYFALFSSCCVDNNCYAIYTLISHKKLTYIISNIVYVMTFLVY